MSSTKRTARRVVKKPDLKSVPHMAKVTTPEAKARDGRRAMTPMSGRSAIRTLLARRRMEVEALAEMRGYWLVFASKKRTTPVARKRSRGRGSALSHLDARLRESRVALASMALCLASQEAKERARLAAGRRNGRVALAELVAREQDGWEVKTRKARVVEGMAVLKSLTVAAVAYDERGRGLKAGVIALATMMPNVMGQKRWAALVLATKALVVSLVTFVAGNIAWTLAGVAGQVTGLVLLFVALASLVVVVVVGRKAMIPRAERTRVDAPVMAPRAVGVAQLLIELLVPKQIADEEIGDAMEYIARMIHQRRPPWQIYLKMASTVFWVVRNAYRASGLRIAKKPTPKRKAKR